MFGFGANKKEKAASEAYEALDALCRPYILSKKLPNIVRTDPYVTGFMSSRVPGICVAASLENGLDQDGAKEVIATVLLKLYGSAQAYSEINSLANSLRGTGNERFLLGYQRGAKFLAFIQQREDITLDPDFNEAMALASSMGLESSTDMSVPLTGLDRIWFGSYMEQYL